MTSSLIIYLRKPTALMCMISILLNAVLWLLVWQSSAWFSEAIILHYNIDVGVDLIGEGQQITMLPIAGTILLVVNGLLGNLLKHVDIRTAWTLWATTPLVHIVLIGTVILLWRINT
jgi:hypothetical protein